MSLAVLGCVALALLSAVVLPTVPSYDPWSWIVWGREVVDPHLSFATGGGPSWKPLPVIFTTVYALLGGAAPTLWVITARAGGLLGLVGAWRVASRLAGRRGTLAGPIAGAVAVLGVLLTQDFFYYMFRGTSEPTVIATAVWAIDRLLQRRHGQAFAVMVAGGLLRPEWWPFLGLYGLWLWFKVPRLRPLVLAGFAAQPLFWFVPPWIGSGQPFLAASHAQEYNGHLGSHPVLTALGRAKDLQVLPVLVAAAIGVALTRLKDRDWTVLALALGAVAWIAVVVAMVIDGYPGLERFFLPASAVLCVLAGVGVARVGLLAGERMPSIGWAPAGVAAALLAVSIPLASSRINDARAQEPTAALAVTTLNRLTDAVKAAGGHARVYPCKSSFAAVNHGVQTALAWKLHVTMGRVGTSMRHPGLDFIGPHNSIDGGPAPVGAGLVSDGVIARAGGWQVVRYVRPGHSAACVGR
ncbi:MAG: hypothetical protein ABSG43_10305 [Solirubrobacteraceae bacterium]